MTANRGLHDRPTARSASTQAAVDAIGRTARGRRVKAAKDKKDDAFKKGGKK